ncbi:MAG: hypothetical protein DRI24_07095 [Deltaproteobacteria bacterium]|nr:MAG: hypothetical protein DRI24_07095 [Deltaproteobacteria bacterium]
MEILCFFGKVKPELSDFSTPLREKSLSSGKGMIANIRKMTGMQLDLIIRFYLNLISLILQA